METVSLLSGLTEALKLAKEATDTAFKADEAINNADAKRVAEATQSLKNPIELLQAEIGKTYGYQLCRCTIPPQICTKIDVDAESLEEISKCPACQQIYPVHMATRYADAICNP